MVIGAGKPLYWIGIASLVGMLALGGCSKKNVAATTSGAEVAAPKVESGPSKPSGDAKARAGSGGDGPLQGISKSPKDEAVTGPPMMVAKADQA